MSWNQAELKTVLDSVTYSYNQKQSNVREGKEFITGNVLNE